MGLDPAYIAKALKDLDQLRRFLASLGPVPADRLQEDLALRLAVLHALQLAIQIVLDVGAHILAGSAAGPVEEYSQIGPRLAQAAVIPPDLGATLSLMARFRNVLVHQYVDVDLARVSKILETSLPDLDACARAFAAHGASSND